MLQFPSLNERLLLYFKVSLKPEHQKGPAIKRPHPVFAWKQNFTFDVFMCFPISLSKNNLIFSMIPEEEETWLFVIICILSFVF